MAARDAWIEPSNTVIRDCWGMYWALDVGGYTHHTVNNGIGFVDKTIAAHTNTIGSTWLHVKFFSKLWQQEGGLHTSPSSLNVRGEVQSRESGPIHKVPSPPRHNRLDRILNPFRIVRHVT